MSARSLVRELFDGPIDIVGDVHGEIKALGVLRQRLGYDAGGEHPEGRRLVFVGDLGDRGPDSPAVVEWVRGLVERGRAQCVLGNHDFNALWANHGGKVRSELSWLFDGFPPLNHHGQHVPQRHVDEEGRRRILAFFASLPVALERGGELPVRVVHACWHPEMIERIRGSCDVMAVFRAARDAIDRELMDQRVMDPLAVKLAHQNRNPIKRLTSGEEGRLDTSILINNEERWEGRMPWWRGYDGVLCVFGHYWRTALPGEGQEFHLFDGAAANALVGPGPAMCIDYSVGKRFKERLRPSFNGTYQTSLAALRLPERVLFFDNGEPLPLLVAASRG